MEMISKAVMSLLFGTLGMYVLKIRIPLWRFILGEVLLLVGFLIFGSAVYYK